MSPVERKAAERLLHRVGRSFLRRYRTTFHGARARELLWEAQDGRCLCCGGKMISRYRHVEHMDSDTCDHVWPKSVGGSDGPGNFALMHKKCNGAKGSRAPTEGEQERLKVINAKLGWPDVTPEVTAPGFE